MANYWENEQPETAATAKNVIRFFPSAGKLQVSNPAWTNDAGEQKQGKTVTLDINSLKENPAALEIIKRAICI